MDVFGQARLKLIWANEHINQLNALWQDFLETDFCELRVEDHPEGGQTLKIVSLNPLPAELILVLGDAVHNLRCALDYTVSELLGWKDTRLTFPMGEDREELVSSFRTEPEIIDGKARGKGRNAAIEVAVPGIGEFIVNEIRPYKAGDGFLWPLGKLDGRDKHRLLIPVLVPQSITGINAVDKNNNRLNNCSGTIDPGGTLNMVLFGSGGVKIEGYGKPTAEIFFNEIGIVEGQAVFPTLVNMSQAVAETINRIQEFATSVGWKRGG
jgi:hypothetical protein